MNFNSHNKFFAFNKLHAILRGGVVLSACAMFGGTVWANQPWSNDRQWLFGDWDGKRSELAEKGYR